MYRSDKQFMKNPATSHLRIYIGNIADSVVPEDLDEKFKVHGPIQGLVLQKGFGFIQFESGEQAQAAIDAEHGTIFHGRKINVKPVKPDHKKNLPPMQGSQPPPPQQQMQKTQEADKPPEEKLPNENMPRQPESDLPPPDKRKRGNFSNHERMGPMRHDNRMNSRFNDDYREPFYPMEEYQPRFEPPPPIERPERNDCEIIVVSKILTEYAEYIEQRLKAVGLIVDLLFPNEDVPIGRVLANISSRGCLYAILVMPQNEENRSLTLNILHGVPQEHRNMPIEDAVLLITRNFDSYMRGEKTAVLNDGKMVLSDRHPENIQMIINLVAENRMLTVPQYDKLLKYLQERRELQIIHDGGEVGESQPEGNKATELQNRILNILNKSADDIKTSVPPPTSNTKPSNVPSTPLLNDPSVQKALDSLLSGDMFKNMSASF